MQLEKSLVSKKDYILVSFIGISFALFSIPILKNLNLPFFTINLLNVLGLIFSFFALANIAIWIAGLIAQKIPVILQIAKFSAVGAFNTFLDWGIVNLLMMLSGFFLGSWFAFFNIISFIIASIGSFFWNKYWTFSNQQKSSDENKKDFLQFSLVTLLSFGLKVGVASLLVNVIGPLGGINEPRWANISLAFGTIFALVWNFLGYKIFVFKK